MEQPAVQPGIAEAGWVNSGEHDAGDGTYNAATGAYTLQWSSQVVGGPFNSFSAFWNLTGTFTPSGVERTIYCRVDSVVPSGAPGATSAPVDQSLERCAVNQIGVGERSTTTTAAPSDVVAEGDNAEQDEDTHQDSSHPVVADHFEHEWWLEHP